MSTNSMRLNLIMGLVDKITGPIQKVTGETTRAAEKIKATQAELTKLGATSKDIEHFRALQERSTRTAEALAEAQAKAQALGRQLAGTADPSRKLTGEFERATAQVKRLQAQHQAERLELQQTGAELKAAGVSTSRLGEATRRIEAQTKRYNDQLAREQKALDEVARREKRLGEIRQRNSDMRMSATADAVGVGAAVFGVKQLVDAYGEVATAQGEIASLGIDPKGIEIITAKAKAFSNQWAGTTAPEFIRAAYDIKSAISTISDEAVGEFTRIAALTGQATKSSTAQMTNLMATGYGIYRRQFDQFGAEVVKGWNSLSAEERDIKFGEYFAAGIATTANLFKTDGPQMADAISNLGAAATSANVSFAEQLAILGQLQTTMSGSEAATKYRAFLTGAAGAGEKLGLAFLDAEDNLKGMPDILAEIRAKYGDTLDALESQELKEAFGTDEAIAALKLLYPEVDTLRGNIDTMGKSLAGGTAEVEKMAAKMNAGPTEAFKLLGQKVHNASADVGKVFAPSMMFAAEVLGNMALWVAALAERFPFLTQVLAYTVVGLLTLKVASIAARFGFAALSDGAILASKGMAFFTVANLRAQAALLVTRIRALTAAAAVVVMGSAARAFAVGAALMTAAQWALNAAMLANPVGLIILGIMALVAVVALVARHWAPLGAFFGELWGRIKAVFSAGWEFIKALFMWTPLGLVIQLWGPLMAFFVGMWSGIKAVFSAAWEFLKSLMSFAFVWSVYLVWEPLAGFFSGLWDRIKSAFSLAWEFIKSLLMWTPLGLIIQAWEPLTEFFGGLWERIKGVFASATSWLTDSVLAPVTAIMDKISGLFGDGVVTVTQKIDAATAAVNAALPPSPDGAAPVAAPGAPVAAPVGVVASPAGRAAAPQQVNQYGGITVQAAPGMSEEQVAKKVRAELDARDRQAARGQRGRLADDS
jgi:TP901 family phage tail tape measure protein